MRIRGFTSETIVDGSWVTSTDRINHYGDETDEPQWIVEDAPAGEITDMVSGPDGDLVASTGASGDVRLNLANLHGDIVVTIDPQTTDPELSQYDEFGVPAAGQGATRYGWLGEKQRSAEACASRGARAVRAGYRAARTGRSVRYAKGFRGARRIKRGLTSRMHHQRHISWRNWRSAECWGKADRRYAYPAVTGYTAGKYRRSCSSSRWTRWMY